MTSLHCPKSHQGSHQSNLLNAFVCYWKLNIEINIECNEGNELYSNVKNKDFS